MRVPLKSTYATSHASPDSLSFSSIVLIIFIVSICLILVIVSIFVTEKQFKKIEADDVSLPEFSVDVYFDPYPKSPKFENQENCNAKFLHKCRLDDPKTLTVCKSFTAHCHHFGREARYMEHGQAYKIPQNIHPNEGYALTITDTVRFCNPHHGDLVLVAPDVGVNKYMLICVCKLDGFIGNDHVFGSCETIRVCEGKVKKLNVPFNEIECVCGETEISAKYNDTLSTPVCKEMLVHEANDRFSDWTHKIKFVNSRLIDVDKFNKTIKRNLHLKMLLDPCRNSLIDSNQIIPGGTYDDTHKSCVFIENGLPLRVKHFPEELQNGPDSANRVASIPLDAAIPTVSYNYARILDKVSGKRSIVNLRATVNLNLQNGKPTKDEQWVANFLLHERVTIGSRAQLKFSIKTEMLNGACAKGMSKEVGEVFSPLYGVPVTDAALAIANRTSYNCVIRNKYSGKLNGIPLADYRDPPIEFLWGTDDWKKSERLTHKGIIANTYGVILDTQALNAFGKRLRFYGICLCSANSEVSDNCHNGALFMSAENDWDLHSRMLDD